MPANNKFRRHKRRIRAIIAADCFADKSLFLPWENLSRAAKNEFDKNGPVPCEGGGIPGEWCSNCRFGKLLNIDMEFAAS